LAGERGSVPQPISPASHCMMADRCGAHGAGMTSGCGLPAFPPRSCSGRETGACGDRLPVHRVDNPDAALLPALTTTADEAAMPDRSDAPDTAGPYPRPR
jgi:hypothetical protein